MSELTPKHEAERILDGPLIEVGQWYWVKNDETGKHEWLACVTHLGSNYILLRSPYRSEWRIHLKDFEKETKREADPESVIRGQMMHYQGVVEAKLGQIREITARLGVDPRTTSKAPPSESRELSTFNAMPDLKKYKKALIKAKDKELPALFEEVKKAHESLATWMTAKTIPMKAAGESLREAVKGIEDRIFNVSLYAGLTEEVEQIADGEPAGAAEKLRLFQRMAFMDEECLLNYKHGGMEFKHVRDFDEWIATPENRDRILPWPRCVVAFRVRRYVKVREWDGSLRMAMLIFNLKEADKVTFLYIRNGEKLFRMTCDQEFGEHIFPSASQVDFTEPMMAKTDWHRVEDIITRRNWETMCREWDEGVRKFKEYEAAHKGEKEYHNPHWTYEHNWHNPRKEYEEFNKDSVYYDDCQEQIASRIKYYNRIALILQGLFDRSDVLHPHAPARLWEPEGFAAAVELVYDGAGAIHFGTPPDFSEYRAKLNATIGKGSFTIGQEEAWGRREAAIENNRWNSRGSSSKHETYHPYGDPGPGYIAEVQEWQPKSGAAIFRWIREPRSWGSRWNARQEIPCVIRVGRDRLFNVSAYKTGDFKQFYQDPRTRADYYEWAELLLSAEEWHAGNLNKDGKLKKKKKS